MRDVLRVCPKAEWSSDVSLQQIFTSIKTEVCVSSDGAIYAQGVPIGLVMSHCSTNPNPVLRKILIPAYHA